LDIPIVMRYYRERGEQMSTDRQGRSTSVFF
jgi:hypothetical protein